MVKRSQADLYHRSRRSGLIAVGLREGDELMMVQEINPSAEVVLVTEMGHSIRFQCREVRAMGRSATGVKGIALRQEDTVVAAVVINGEDRHELLTIAGQGYGKRTPIEKYRLQTRGGKGVINMRITPKTGHVIGAVAVSEEDEIILLTSGNKIIRLLAKDVSLVGRATQGVRLVRLDKGGTVAGFDLVRENVD